MTILLWRNVGYFLQILYILLKTSCMRKSNVFIASFSGNRFASDSKIVTVLARNYTPRFIEFGQEDGGLNSMVGV